MSALPKTHLIVGAVSVPARVTYTESRTLRSYTDRRGSLPLQANEDMARRDNRSTAISFPKIHSFNSINSLLKSLDT